MKQKWIFALVLGLAITGCLPGQATESPAPSIDLNATADVLAQQTLQAIPSPTLEPTNTPVVVSNTSTNKPTATGTLTDASASIITTGSASPTSTQATTTPSFTSTFTSTPIGNTTATETLHPRFYGTLPPNLPFGQIELVNKSKAEAYISLQVTTSDGYVTIIEYPVGRSITVKAPAGKYKYVAWVGGNKLLGSFGLGKADELRITIYKDKIEVKSK